MHPRFDDLYKDIHEEDYKDMPRGESLKMVRERVTPYWNEIIKPTL
jgi:bisphosphoglycerate-dependent phosphoglycerate mutase